MPDSQDFADDPRNAGALLWRNGALMPKREAKVSAFDAGFTMGNGVWVGRSTGFAPPNGKPRAPLGDALQRVADDATRLHDALRVHRPRAS